MARPENPNRNIGVTNKETNNHDSPENSQKARNVDEESLCDNLHDKDHRNWGYDNPFSTRGAFVHNHGKSKFVGHARDKHGVHQKRPCNEETSGHEATNLIVKEGDKLFCDLNVYDTGLVGEAGHSKLTTKNNANGSNNIHCPGYIRAGMNSMILVRMGSDAELPDNNHLETSKGDCIVLSIHNEENIELVHETLGTMMKEDEGQYTLMDNAQVLRRVLKHVKWVSPPYGTFKLNIDGSSFGNLGRTGFRGLICCARGLWIFGFSGYVGLSTNMHGELKSILHGLTHVWDSGFRNVICHSDSLESISLIKGNIHHFHMYITLAFAIKELLNRERIVLLDHVVRETNLCANFLAKLGAREDISSKVWEQPPNELSSLLSRDQNGHLYVSV
ncbi:unnamed protein product [Lupinus luteus]|uniref:RNase H type-1 domain-containing protein n=1 Tax=Lupinus luteus TaxID=3873 RepID=A0AAV1WAU4_LUPLU